MSVFEQGDPMPQKSSLETSVAQAAAAFAAQIVDAVRGATLQELIALQGAAAAKVPGKKRGPKAGRKAKAVPKAAKAAAKPKAKKRVVKNYPKCAYPKCGKNRFPRGKGFCGEHFKAFEAGKIKAAKEYRK